MRGVIIGFFLVSVSAVPAFAQFVEQQRATLAVETCNVKPGGVSEMSQALKEMAAYVRANPVDLPGNVYGVFREVAAPGDILIFVLEVKSMGEFEDYILAREAANNSDERRGTLFRAWRSHLDAESCNWSFQVRVDTP